MATPAPQQAQPQGNGLPDDLFANVGSSPAAASPQAQVASAQGNGLPDNLFDSVGVQATQGGPAASPASPAVPPPAGQPQGQPAGSVAAPTAPPPNSNTIDPAELANPASPIDALGAVTAGAAKGLFAAKDFFATGAGLFGSAPPEDQRSDIRKLVDQYSAAQSAKWGAGYSFAEGIGQAAVGLLGASTGLGAIGDVGVVAKTAAETLGGVASFEPHAQNFANLAQQVPGLNGPLTQFFASSPTDSDTMGYMKNALISLGLSSVLVGTFVGSAAMLRALKSGDSTAIASAHLDLEDAIRDHVTSLHQEEHPPASSSSATGDTPWASQEPTQSSQASSSSLEPSTSSASQSTPSGLAQGEPLASGEAQSSPSSSSATSDTASSPPSGDSSAASSATSPAFHLNEEQFSNAIAGGDTAAASPSSSAPRFELDEEQFRRFIQAADDDHDAFLKYGSWDAAIANGHTFAPTTDIPWQVIGGANTGQAETDIDAFMARVADAYRSQLDDVKGGAIQSDQATQRAVNLRVKLWGEDPGALLGELTAAGEGAQDLRANMQASFTIAQRFFQDAWTLSQRIKLGDLDEYGGSLDSAQQALKNQMAAAMQAYGAAQSIRANVGRAMRGLRSEFRLDPIAIRNIASMDPSALQALLDGTQGDPMALSRLGNPHWMTRVAEGLQLFLVNNLISSPLTHTIIAASNLWQATGRPLMRAAGSLATGTADTVGREAMSQLYYTPSAVGQAYEAAKQAFRVGDSIIAPHDVAFATGGSQAATGLGQAIAQLEFKPWDSIGNVLHNALVSGLKTGAFPSRMVGFQDELVKQTVYRSIVQAKALSEGRTMGLAGDDLAQHVKASLYNAFDALGRGTDATSLQEAKIATYQNDLNPTGNFGWKTFGAAGQQALQNNPYARVIIPFMRTPVNLFRQSIQLTPGLNMLQQEYREMLSGAVGATEAERAFNKAQAVGQFAMGSLLMGAMGTLAYQGYVTGDAPSNGKLKAEAMQDGWKPNSIVIPHADGSHTYIPYDRWDPIMLPMAMAANIVSVLNAPEVANQNKAQSMLGALFTVMVHQMTDKLYLQNLKDTIDVLQDPNRSGAKWAGKMASNYIPYASGLRLFNTDPYLREADTFISAAFSKLPFVSSAFSPRRDWAGDPITVHKGLWSNIPGSASNDEINRLALQQDASIGPPASRASGGIDLRGLIMSGDVDPESKGRDAYDRYQELAGHPNGAPSMRQAIEQIVADPRYQALPDGAADTPGTKLSILMDTIHRYRSFAMRQVGADSTVRAAETEELRRVATARGQAATPNPTPTNTLSRVLKQLGARVGLSLSAPSPAQSAASASPPSSPKATAANRLPDDLFGDVGKAAQ